MDDLKDMIFLIFWVAFLAFGVFKAGLSFDAFAISMTILNMAWMLKKGGKDD